MSVRKNLIYNIAYQMLNMIIPLITTPYISRILGAEKVGIQSYTYSVANYFVLFAMLGVNNHGNRSIAMVRDHKKKLSKTFWSIYIFQAIISSLVLVAYFNYIIFIVKDNKLIAFIQGIYILGALLDLNWFFFGIEEFRLTVIRNIIIKIISTISIFIFVKDSGDLPLYALILGSGILLSQVILWHFLRKYIHFVKVKIKDIVNQIKPNLVLFVPEIAVSIYKVMDKIMIGSMSNMVQVGFYENSEKIINIPIGIIAALGTVMLPKMSNLQANGKKEESIRYIELSMKFVAIVFIGSTFALIGISPVLVPIFLGEEFIDCIELISLLSITLLFISWANVIRTQYLIPNKKDGIYIASTMLGAIVNLIINIILIPQYGAKGAVIGTIFAEAAVCIYQTIRVRKELDIKKYFKSNAFYFIPGIIMCIVLRYSERILKEPSIITEIILGSLIY